MSGIRAFVDIFLFDVIDHPVLGPEGPTGGGAVDAVIQ